MASEMPEIDTETDRAVLPIALVFGRDRDYSSSVLRGIGRFARHRRNWALVSLLPHRRLGEALETLKPAGIIVNDVCKGIDAILLKAGQPIVTTCMALHNMNFAHVSIDDFNVGAIAANCLLESGLHNFGYFGPPWNSPTEEREGGFCSTLQNLAYTVATCYVRPPGPNPAGGTFASQKHVFQWIHQLPKPAGVFTPNDTWARWLCGVCRQENIRVPDDIAIVGAGNDELMCELAQPSISSVVIPAERIGYEGASLLDRLINREPVPEKPILLPASGVVTRQSSNIMAGIDSGISAAVRYIHEHISEPIVVDDLLQHVVMSRRSFEQKFLAAMGRSPAQEIRYRRIATAKTLLAGNIRITAEAVARQCGFSSTAQFFTAFHNTTGMTPTDYRRTMSQEPVNPGDSDRH
jgi:LacI family transcriptional regulator